MSYVPKLLALCNCVIIMGMIVFTIFSKTKPMLFEVSDYIVMIISVLVSYAMVNIVRMIEGIMYHNEDVINFQSGDKESEM